MVDLPVKHCDVPYFVCMFTRGSISRESFSDFNPKFVFEAAAPIRTAHSCCSFSPQHLVQETVHSCPQGPTNCTMKLHQGIVRGGHSQNWRIHDENSDLENFEIWNPVRLPFTIETIHHLLTGFCSQGCKLLTPLYRPWLSLRQVVGSLRQVVGWWSSAYHVEHW